LPLKHKDIYISDAFSRVGGFGPYQLFFLILFSIGRNYGSYPYYGFAYMIQEPIGGGYLCRNSSHSAGMNEWEECTKEEICELKNLSSVEYKYVISEDT